MATCYHCTKRVAPLLATMWLVVTTTCAQPMPDDDPSQPHFRDRMRHADSLTSLGRTTSAIAALEELRGAALVRDRVEDYSLLLMKLARSYASLGDVDRAYERASEAQLLGHRVWRELATSHDFALVRQSPRFAQLISRARAHEIAWERLSVPPVDVRQWSDTLSLSSRMYGVSAIWSAVRYSYAYFDRTSMRWDSLYVATIAAMTQSSSAIAYYRTLQRMVASLGDGHTTVLYPQELVDTIGYYPRLRTALVSGHVIIVDVLEPRLGTDSIDIGDEILAIDGVDVHAFATAHVIPFIAGSSVRDRLTRAYGFQLLGGPFNSLVALDVVSADGRRRQVTVPRRWCWDDVARPQSIEYRPIDSLTAYCAINSFDDEYVVDLFDAAMRRHPSHRALIIDLRDNGGGHSRLAFQIMARLMVEPFETHGWETPMHRGYFASRGRNVEWFRQAPGCVDGTGRRAFTGRIVLIVGNATLSAAENFVVAFANARRGTIIGDTTAGSTGHTIEVPLPGGGACMITTTRDLRPDGSEFNGSGIAPDVIVRASVDDIRARYDRSLWVARALLTHAIPR